MVFDGKDARVLNFEEPGNPLRERKRAEVLRYSRGTRASTQITSTDDGVEFDLNEPAWI